MAFLTTARLVLRPLAPKDVPIMHDYRNNPVCARFQRGQTTDLAGIQALVARRQNDAFSLDAAFMMAVALADTDEMVGEIVVMPNALTISLGYTFSYRHHRKGYAYEALSALIAELHARWPDWELICCVEPENVASIALLKKLEFADLGYEPELTSQIFGLYAKE